jgi:multidrug efflux pump subunit AcrB
MREMRRRLPREFPELSFYFQPADIVSQILNFGLPAPIDIQVAGLNREETYRAARAIEARVRRVPGAVDVHLHQVVDAPRLHVAVDRTRAAEVGLTQRDVANNVLVSLASSILVTPNFWTDGRSGIAYPVAVQVPPRLVDSVDDLRTTAMVAPGVAVPQLLGDLASVERRTAPVVANHSNIQPTFNVRADVQDTDLGAVSGAIRRIVHEYETKLPPGSSITLRGQVESMDTSFGRLGLGLVFAALLVYGVMVVNFQSWTDPFIIITALPGALVGIVWMLFATQTTFSVPSLMGAIMTIGVATANSILLVTFANDQRREGLDAGAAALAAGRTRLRPVLMTAAAMMIGMLPMSLGLGEGGEQNAPLGRAVIGGLLVATAATLFFVPTVYTFLRRRPPQGEDVESDGSAS